MEPDSCRGMGPIFPLTTPSSVVNSGILSSTSVLKPKSHGLFAQCNWVWGRLYVALKVALTTLRTKCRSCMLCRLQFQC